LIAEIDENIFQHKRGDKKQADIKQCAFARIGGYQSLKAIDYFVLETIGGFPEETRLFRGWRRSLWWCRRFRAEDSVQQWQERPNRDHTEQRGEKIHYHRQRNLILFRG
jgi:hypothetical protein